MPPGSVAGRSASLLQRRDARAPESQDGKQAEQDTAQHRDGQREEQDRRVDTDVVDTRQLRRRDRSQQPRRGLGERHADRTARECQHHALRQQRARDAATTRPKRRTHGEFLLASFRAHQEQVRHVPAGDEQHDADGGQENPQDLPDVADHVIGQRAHVRPQLQSRKDRREKRDHARHIGVGLGQRDARLQPRERLKPEADSARAR